MAQTNAIFPDPLSVLLVGEGNLSFTYSLVRRLSHSTAVRRATQNTASSASGPSSPVVVEVVATTFDTAAELDVKYPESTVLRAYFAEKQRVPVRYCGGVNATALTSSLEAHLRVQEQPFHLIVFNNPHIGFEDLYRQRSLLCHFFASAGELRRVGPVLSHPQQLVVALCDDQAQRWDLLGCAARNGYICVAAQPLLSTGYPEYTNRRHQSDAAFPFRRMVQFWFVPFSAELQVPLRQLQAEMRAWQCDRDARVETKEPSSFSCAAWLQTAETFLRPAATSPGAAATTTASAVDTDAERLAVPSDRDDGIDAFFNFGSSGGETPVPLLDPKVVSSVLSYLSGCGGLSEQCNRHFFIPYLPSCAWAAAYRVQREVEHRQRCKDAATETEKNAASVKALPPPAAPPHLDAACLGRPLTSKEAKKLERFLTGYGAAMKAKALQQKREMPQGVGDWECTACVPPRIFGSRQDLEQHESAKHSGAVQLAPTLYARVHQQIETAPRPSSEFDASADVETAVAAMALNDTSASSSYCAVCHLHFKTLDAYQEHLDYLSPLPGEKEGSALVCEQCNPPKHFTDRRGLEQHRSSKHPTAS